MDITLERQMALVLVMMWDMMRAIWKAIMMVCLTVERWVETKEHLLEYSTETQWEFEKAFLTEYM